MKLFFVWFLFYGILCAREQETIVLSKENKNILRNDSRVIWQGEYDKALQKARDENKPLLVFSIKIEEPELSLGRKILKTYFMHRPYISSINQKVVPVLVTYMQKSSYPIEMYYTTKFPVLFLVDSQKELFLNEPLYANEITPQNIKKLLSSF